MRTIYDVLPVDMTCDCGQEMFELVGRLKKTPHVTCSFCNNVVTLSEREVQEKVERVHIEFKELTGSLKRLGALQNV